MSWKNCEKTGKFTEERFLEKSILCFCCNSKRNNLKYLKFIFALNLENLVHDDLKVAFYKLKQIFTGLIGFFLIIDLL